MKKTYNAPEIEVIKFSFDEIMTDMVDISEPEEPVATGDDVDL